MPLALIRVYDSERNWGVEAIAQGDGPPRGRELEIADILSFIKRAGIRNTLWITADVHYTAAHYYDPNKAVFQDFEPFWEFVSGPIHAGTFGSTSSTTRSGRSSCSTRTPVPDGAILPRATGCSSSATSPSTVQPT